MSSFPIRVFLDRNDAEWTSQRHYVDRLAEEFEQIQRVRTVDELRSADVVHLNYLNPLGRVVHGKEDLKRHLADVASVFRGLDVPVVVTEHGVEEFSEVGESMYLDSNAAVRTTADGVKRGIQRLFSTQVDAIITISTMDRRYLVDAGFDPERLHHVPHGVGEVFLESTANDESDFVLHVSKCSPHKNPDAIIKLGERIDTDLKIVGAGWRENYGDRLSAIDSVDVLGYVSKERLLELYRTAQVFYFPSTYEPFGLPILEAMASGTPVVASINSAAPDLCEDGIALVDPLDVGSHVEAVTRLLTDPDLRRTRGTELRENAKEFVWKRTATSTLDVYERLMTDHSSC